MSLVTRSSSPLDELIFAAEGIDFKDNSLPLEKGLSPIDNDYSLSDEEEDTPSSAGTLPELVEKVHRQLDQLSTPPRPPRKDSKERKPRKSEEKSPRVDSDKKVTADKKTSSAKKLNRALSNSQYESETNPYANLRLVISETSETKKPAALQRLHDLFIALHRNNEMQDKVAFCFEKVFIESNKNVKILLADGTDPGVQRIHEFYFNLFKGIYTGGFLPTKISDETIQDQITLLFTANSLENDNIENHNPIHSYKFLSRLIPAYSILAKLSNASLGGARQALGIAIPAIFASSKTSHELEKQTVADGTVRSYFESKKCYQTTSQGEMDPDYVRIRITGPGEVEVTQTKHYTIFTNILTRIQVPQDPSEETKKKEQYSTALTRIKIGEMVINYIIRHNQEVRHRLLHHSETLDYPLYTVEIIPSQMNRLGKIDLDPQLRDRPEIVDAFFKARKELKKAFDRHLKPKTYKFNGYELLCEKK